MRLFFKVADPHADLKYNADLHADPRGDPRFILRSARMSAFLYANSKSIN